MDIPQGYKQTELGVIPDDWDVKKLGEIAVVSSGGTPNRSNPFYWNGNIPWITTSQIDFNTIISSNEFITELGLQNSAAKLYDQNTLLMAMYGQGKTRGKVAILGIDATINQACAAISLNKDVSNDYVLFYLAHNYEEIRKLSNTGNQENLNGNIIKSIFVPLPPLPEQKAIAQSLSDVDALITAIDKLITKKRNIKQGAMQELLTGKKRLPGFTGDRDVKNFGDLVVVRKQKIDPRKEGRQPFCVELEHIKQGGGQLIGYSETTSKSSIKTIFCKDDILFGKLRAYLRKYWLADRGGVASTEIWPLVARFDVVLPEYIYQLIQTDSFIESASISYGTHMPRTDWNVIKTYSILLPPLPEQKAIAQILSDMDAEIERLEKTREKYKLIKRGIMQELLTGKTRLKHQLDP